MQSASTSTEHSLIVIDILKNLTNEGAEENLPLTPDEAADLERLEKIVEDGFIAIGTALAEIRDRRLWRGSAASFDAYCRSRFGHTARQAGQKIQAANVVVGIAEQNPELVDLISNEAVASALGEVPAEQRAEVLTAAVGEAAKEGKARPKARHVKAAAAGRSVKTGPRPPKKTKSTYAVSITVDSTGDAEFFRPVFGYAGLGIVGDSPASKCLQAIAVTPDKLGLLLALLGQHIQADAVYIPMILSIE